MPNRESSNTKNLVIYRASAGSGKTHRLTEEYLRLLFEHPFAYRHILAVTFTNKATDEMKTRIIKELHNLASDQKSDYLAKLMSERAESENKIRERAKQTLVYILHDYSAFSINTIDRFFQQTMRAFTRELGLGGGYNVELDTGKVLTEAIDSLLSDLEKSDNKQLLEWLIRFSEEKIENGETWNIRNDIQALSTEIFKESYKVFSDDVQNDIKDKTLLDSYKKELLSIIRSYEKTSQEIGEKALNIIDRFALSIDDFKGGSRSPFATFKTWAQGEIKTPSNTFIKLANEIENWSTAKADTNTKSKIEEAYNAGLNDCVCRGIDHYENTLRYQTAFEINRYYFTLGILGDIDKKIREYTAENNILLISDTTELLHKIVKDSDSPFIYEKVGTYINHYMIDEFQDTSGMQWSNFRPLIKDSLAAGNRNLVVGDVKQSIYRWRNSDWKLLDEQVDLDFRQEGVEHKSLDTNWRSAKNIVDFNNAIFCGGAKILQDEFNESLESSKDERVNSLSSKIKKAYNDAYQHLAPNKKDIDGQVKLEFVDTDEHTNWQAHVLKQLPLAIEDLQEKGYRLKDIAILVRTKKEGAEVANALLEYKGANPHSKYRYDIISDEALFLKNSQSIRLIVSLLKYLRNPSDTSLQSLASYEYYKFRDRLSAEEALLKHFSLQEKFPEAVTSRLKQIANLPLYEMVESIFDLFHKAMEENENVYIQSFMDMVLDFSIRKSSDLDAFLRWWDETGITKTIFTPDGQDAIRIMTIHKSKGLGFDVVIVPFCNWEIDHKLTNILWCQPKVPPFDQLHLVPVKYSSKLANTIFEYEYFNEKLHAYIDNINVMYVAFTRAKKSLIAYSPKPTKDKVSNISSLLWATINNNIEVGDKNTYIDLSQHLNQEDAVFELGKDYTPAIEKEEKASDEIAVGLIPSVPYDNRLKLKLNNKYFFSDKGQREYGNLMHEIISKVECIADLEKVVESYLISGDITQDEKKTITERISRFLSNESVSEWYSGAYRVLNEVEILQPKGSFTRPDRVMIKGGEVTVIDYKFGGKEDNKYIRQVKSYVSQIEKMGYENVSGYICYVTLDKVVDIKGIA